MSGFAFAYRAACVHRTASSNRKSSARDGGGRLPVSPQQVAGVLPRCFCNSRGVLGVLTVGWGPAHGLQSVGRQAARSPEPVGRLPARPREKVKWHTRVFVVDQGSILPHLTCFHCIADCRRSRSMILMWWCPRLRRCVEVCSLQPCTRAHWARC